jgi:pyruvate formate lyase activating enzyme
MDRLMDRATPEQIAAVAKQLGCKSVAYTYNDPIIFAEYALDTARACRAADIKNVAVTAGYIHPEPRAEFFALMDAANVDLKGFTDDFYVKYCGAHLQPVLDTLEYLVKETDCWVELTTLIIPTLNDSDDELRRLADWVREHLGPDVPLHFSAYHPDYKLRDLPATPRDTLRRARDIAIQAGLHYVYTGNVHDAEGDTTFCPGCKQALIERDWYDIKRYALSEDGRCPHCGIAIAGRYQRFDKAFGARRIPVSMARA